MSKQTTLFKYGVAEKRIREGVAVNVGPTMPHFTTLNGIFKCSVCLQGFHSNAAVSMHKKWKHPKSYSEEALSTITIPSTTVRDALSVVSKPDEEDDVALVMERLLNSVERNLRQPVKSKRKRSSDGADDNGEKRGPQRGSNVRKSYSFSFRMNVLNQCDEHKCDSDVAFVNNINKSILSKWKKDRVNILNQAMKEHTRLLTKGRKSKKHDELFKKLLPKFRAAREKGRVVSFSWLYTHASNIHKELNPGADVRRLSPSVVVSFTRKFKIKMRRVQCRKQKPRSEGVADLMAWHTKLREGIIKTGPNLPFYDSKFGRYSPDRRFNVDQVPMPFAINLTQTYEEGGARRVQRNRRVWVAQPGAGLEKRQCSLQVCFSPVTNSCRIAIVFRGTGKRISADEKASYHPSVDVYWQPCAWVDREVAQQWVKKTFKAATEGKEEVLLFCDNLDAQTYEGFRDELKKVNSRVCYGPKNLTNCWQPVDAGYGKLLKTLSLHEQQLWLEKDENIERWVGNAERETFTAKERRILITHWVGEAHLKLQEPKYDRFRRLCFEKTGCLITADGSDDALIKPEGLPDFVVTPPLPTIPATDPFAAVIPEPEPIPVDDYLGEEEEGNFIEIGDAGEEAAPTPADDSLPVDDVSQRDLNHNLVNRELEVFYPDEGGWFVGKITWYNIHLGKFRVLFDDGSDDYIQPEDINDLDVKLL